MAFTKTMTDWKTEDSFWRSEYKKRPYGAEKSYEYWQPAYKYGFEMFGKYPNKHWREVEPDLNAGWDLYEGRFGNSTWEEVKHAVRDAWDRMTDHR